MLPAPVRNSNLDEPADTDAPVIAAIIYLPSVSMILRRPDEDDVALTGFGTTFRIRIAASLMVGLVAGWLCAIKATTGTDFEFFWRATRLFATGINPYAMRPGSSGWSLPDAFFYPAPALIVVWPLHPLVLPVAAGIFMGVGSGLLAWFLSRDGLWRLWMLGTPSFIMAVAIGQWSPLITLGALTSGGAFLLACKPTLGLACFTYRPGWRAAIGVAAVLVFSLVLLPEWPREWLDNLKLVERHPLPIATPLGWLVLLALMRWRQPEARLLIGMACVPQLLFFADQLPLGLVARTRGEAVGLAICGVIAFATWWAFLKAGDAYVMEAQPFVMAGIYLPALVMVLHRPNVGIMPQFVEKTLMSVRTNFRRGA